MTFDTLKMYSDVYCAVTYEVTEALIHLSEACKTVSIFLKSNSFNKLASIWPT